jgi:hypothetical protein
MHNSASAELVKLLALPYLFIHLRNNLKRGRESLHRGPQRHEEMPHEIVKPLQPLQPLPRCAFGRLVGLVEIVRTGV